VKDNFAGKGGVASALECQIILCKIILKKIDKHGSSLF
jgi:hypothetical protein